MTGGAHGSLPGLQSCDILCRMFPHERFDFYMRQSSQVSYGIGYQSLSRVTRKAG